MNKNLSLLMALGTAFMSSLVLQGCKEEGAKSSAAPLATSEKKDENTPQSGEKAALSKQETSSTSSDVKPAVGDTEKSTSIEAEKVLVKFADGKKITLKDISDALRKVPAELQKKYSYADLRQLVVEIKINEYLISEAIASSGFEKTADVQKKIALLRDNFLQKKYIESKVKAPSESEIKSKYDAIKKEVLNRKETEVLLRQIVFATQQEADDFIKKSIEAKMTVQNFIKIAKEKSVDPKTKEKGGELGYIRKGMFPNKEFEASIFEAKPGTILPQAIPYESGFSVVQVGDSRLAEFPKLETIKDKISEIARNEKMSEFVKELRQKKGCKVFNLKGEKISEPDNKKPAEQPEEDITKIDEQKTVIMFSKDEKYTLKQLKEFCKENGVETPMLGNFQLYQQIIFQVCYNRLLSAEVKKSDLEKDTTIMKEFDELKVDELRNIYVQETVEAKVTDSDINKLYKQFTDKLPKGEIKVRLRLIPFKTKDEAESAWSEIKKNPKKFDEYVENSGDPQLKARKGDIGYVTRKELSKGAADQIFKAKPATLVGVVEKPFPMVEWAIVRLEDKQDVMPPKKEEIIKELRREAGRKKLGEVTKELQKKAGIERFDDAGKPLVVEMDEQENPFPPEA